MDGGQIHAASTIPSFPRLCVQPAGGWGHPCHCAPSWASHRQGPVVGVPPRRDKLPRLPSFSLSQKRRPGGDAAACPPPPQRRSAGRLAAEAPAPRSLSRRTPPRATTNCPSFQDLSKKWGQFVKNTEGGGACPSLSALPATLCLQLGRRGRRGCRWETQDMPPTPWRSAVSRWTPPMAHGSHGLRARATNCPSFQELPLREEAVCRGRVRPRRRRSGVPPSPHPRRRAGARPPWTHPLQRGTLAARARQTAKVLRTFLKQGQVQDARNGTGETQRRAPDHPSTLCRRGRRRVGAPSSRAVPHRDKLPNLSGPS